MGIDERESGRPGQFIPLLLRDVELFGRPLAITQGGAGCDRDLQWGAGLKEIAQIGYLFDIRILTKFSKSSVSRRPVMTRIGFLGLGTGFPGFLFLMIPSRGSPLGPL